MGDTCWAFIATSPDGRDVRVIGYRSKRKTNKARVTMKYTGVARHLSGWAVGPVFKVVSP